MTTVVCGRGTMVSDSLAFDGETSCQVTKIFRIRKGLLGIAGNVGAAMAFVSWFRGGCKKQPPNTKSIEALYLTPDGRIMCFDSTHYAYEIKDDYSAIGSGAATALGALDAGADLKSAVKIAIKRDPGSGGRLQIRRL